MFYSGLALLLWAYGGSRNLAGDKVEQNCWPRGQGGREGKKRPSPRLEGKSFPVESCFCLSSAGDRLAHRATEAGEKAPSLMSENEFKELGQIF